MRNNLQRGETTTSTVAWIALIIGVIALVWVIFGTGETTQVDDEVRQFTQNAAEEIDQRAALAEARLELVALRDDINEPDEREDVLEQIAETRQDLAEDFADAESNVRQKYTQLDADLERLANAVRQGSGDALNILEQILDDIRGGFDA